jgi:hypothetical protein
MPSRRSTIVFAAAAAAGLMVGCPALTTPAPRAPSDNGVVMGAQVELIAVTPGFDQAVFLGRRRTPPGEDFTIVALPDTQYYSESYPEIFLAQTRWIVENRAARNIVAVTHLGDIVDNADQLYQWEAADAALSVLDAMPDLPYGLAVGNHDEFPQSDPDGTATFNLYFPFSRYQGLPWYGGHFGEDNDNHYILFSGGALDFVAVFLEFAPGGSADALAWADSVLGQYADRHAIVVTHYALTGHALNNKFSGQGKAIRDALGDNENLFLTLGGHFCGTGVRTDDFAAANVHTVLADYQCWQNGGDGWLRLIEFSPAGGTIRTRTYSPTRDEYLLGEKHEFTLPLTILKQPPFEQIGEAHMDATDSTTVSAIWTDLEPGAQYEWFVRTTLNGIVRDSSVRTFCTE